MVSRLCVLSLTYFMKGRINMVFASRGLLVLVFVAALVVIQPNCAYACSCRPPGSPAEELGESDVVFLGRVVSVATPNKPIENSSDVTTVTFETSKGWKGDVTQTLTLTTPGSSASCGVSFVQGEEYVVYAQSNEGTLTTNLCSRTNTVANATEDITALGAGQTPVLNSQATPAQLPTTGVAGSGTMALLLMIIAAVALVTGVAVRMISRVTT